MSRVLRTALLSVLLLLPFAPVVAQDDAGVAEATQLVAELEKPVTFVAPGPAIDVGDKVKGKTIYFIANGLNFPFVQNLLAGVQEAADMVGMEVVAVDGAGDSTKAANLVEQGIARSADVIVLQSFPAEQLSESVKAAKEAGIPVVEISGRDPQLPPKEIADMGVSAIASFCYGCAGRQMAQFIVADSKGKASVVVFDVPEIGVSVLERTGFTEELARLCPDCKVKVVEAPLAQWGQTLASLTSSAIQSDPEVNYLVPEYDAMISIMEPAVIAANAEESVRFVSYNGTLPPLQTLDKGGLVAADVGGMNRWVGWAAMDQILRVLTGNPPAADTMISNRIFTASNIKSIDLTKDEADWYGDIDLKAEYGALWGFTPMATEEATAAAS